MGTRTETAVVIPGYERPELLVETLTSVERQTEPPAELVVVDDGSPTPLEPVVAPFLERNAAWRYVRQENRGAAAARNRGVEETTAPLIAFLDADDIWLPEKLARHRERHDADDTIGLTFSACTFFSREQEAIKVRPRQAPEGDVYAEIVADSFISTLSSVVVRRELFEELEGFDERYRVVDDYHFYYRAARRTRFGFLRDPLVRYRCHDRNLSVQALRRGHDERVDIFGRLLRECDGERPDIQRIVRRKLAYYLVKSAQDRARDGELGAAIERLEEARRVDPWSLKALKYTALYHLRSLFSPLRRTR